ncbi:MAG TPA: TetR/AcrR family transcriptional regulator [Burkholderiaceae bacterium]|nr:TetR/AcrR family transcriptional regulator [Burkholderiaceae bacterium]
MTNQAASLPGSARQALVEAARELFLEQGFQATSLEQVRLRAGVSNGSLYHHFPTKNHLARALYEATLADYHAAVLRAIDDDVPGQEGVRGLVLAHIAWVVRRPMHARVLHELRHTTAIAGMEPDWGALNAEAFARLRRWVEARQARGDLRAMPFAVWLALVFAPVLQLSARWAQEGNPVPLRLRALLADAAWAAVGP